MILGHFIVIATQGSPLTQMLSHVLVSLRRKDQLRAYNDNNIIIIFIDVDECFMHVDDCDHNCNNTVGSYTCSCNDGYTLDEDGLQCNGMIM